LANAPPAKRGQKPQDPGYISTDPAGPQRLHLYAVRLGVDEMFRDLKGQGFHLDQTRREHPERIERLMLVSARIDWRLLDLGIWVDRLGLRRRVGPGEEAQGQLVHDWVALVQAPAAFR